MRIHQKVVKSVFCPDCPKTFANASNMKQHFEKKHKEGKMESKIDVGTVINKGI